MNGNGCWKWWRRRSRGGRPSPQVLQTRPAPEAASKVALLSRLGPQDLEDVLPSRLRDWDPVAHDMVVRQLANSLAPQRGKLLEKIYDLLDRTVLPEVVDELGMSGDCDTSPRLMRIVERGAPTGRTLPAN